MKNRRLSQMLFGEFPIFSEKLYREANAKNFFGFQFKFCCCAFEKILQLIPQLLYATLLLALILLKMAINKKIISWVYYYSKEWKLSETWQNFRMLIWALQTLPGLMHCWNILSLNTKCSVVELAVKRKIFFYMRSSAPQKWKNSEGGWEFNKKCWPNWLAD